MTRASSSRVVLSLACSAATLLLFAGGSASAQQLYKWTDEEGHIRYSDHLPADQKKKRHQKLSPDGHVIQTEEAAIPPEELARRRAEQKRQEEEAKRLAEQAAKERAIKDHHDNVLLMTFSNEKEIIEAQNERVAVISSVITLLRKNISNEERKLAELEKSAHDLYLSKNRVVPGGLAQNIEYFQEKILGIQQQLALKLEERDRVKQQYVVDLLRYRELTENADKDQNR